MSDNLRPSAPLLLAGELQSRRQDLAAAFAAAELAPPIFSRAEQDALDRVLLASNYAFKQFCAKPAMLDQLLQSGELDRDSSAQDIQLRLSAQLADIAQEADLVKCLRSFRHREMTRLIWRDFNRTADTMTTTRELSWLAGVCLDASLDWLYQRMCADIGTPIGQESGVPQHLVIIGMGKLGAWELNLSSDIDLIFSFPEGGETSGGRRTLSNQDFFVRLGQALIRVLDSQGHDGFVFRVDMRLRPYGESGALASSFDAMEAYYHEQGREWERYAMVKARVVAGDQVAGARLMAVLAPFVYRRYIDFSAFDSLRAMKQMINREVQRRRLGDDIKLGPGGIREVEFIVQAFQLIRGGRDKSLQERRLLVVLEELGKLACLPLSVVAELRAAYLFLRNTEHAIQGYEDAQTQLLPSEPRHQAAIAWVLGFSAWPEFVVALNAHRDKVRRNFVDVIAPAEEAVGGSQSSLQWADLWQGAIDEEQGRRQFAEHGFDPVRDYNLLVGLRDSRRTIVMQKLGRERLDRLMPVLLEELCHEDQPGLVLERVLPLLEAVQRRTAYLVLLLENQIARQQLYILCGASPLIAQQLARQPVLLDELANVASLYRVPEKTELRDELRQQVLRLEWDDLEGHMEALRYFRLAHVLHIAASEVTGRLPLMKVSDYLSFLAEVILEHVVQLAWRDLVRRHGRPRRLDGSVCELDFVVLGYGKLGGLELGHGSDLDLVFVHDADAAELTDGDKPIAGQVFYTRLGQRIIHVLNTATTSGKLYEVDMRLRPSGNSGLLVTSLAAFEQYQRQQAWTWEHQALVRSRPVAGDPLLAARLDRLRTDVLCQPRDIEKLRQEVLAMRHKMREHLLPASSAKNKAPVFDLKQGVGGIVDIEFMVQFAVLAYASKFPELAVYTDNIRILEAMVSVGLVSSAQEEQLQEAYKAYRARAHRLSLQEQAGVVNCEEYAAERALVMAEWFAFEQGKW